MDKQGKVWLAGAGPGDGGLLTVKTKMLLEQVDVIVYDALVSAEIISQIPAGTRLIYVGKRSGNHTVVQEEINQILLDEAKQGHQVLRLKGGDPFIFGRGGEELEGLAAAGVAFEVVPGVTSAAAVPAYAGIPLTHRDYTSSVHIITGHSRKGGESRINYQALAALNGTLVFLMGIAALTDICQGLIAAGMDQDMPAAVLERGTLAGQRRVVSTLQNLYSDTQRAEITAPAIILVGKVCMLEQAFNWAERRVLGGRQLLVTRPRQRSSQLAFKLRELGAQVIELPAIQTKAIEHNQVLKEGLISLDGETREAWLAFTSPIGVQVFFEQLTGLQLDIRQLFKGPGERKIAAIGSATARELRNYGISADLVPEQYCAVELGRLLAGQAEAGSRIIIVRAKEGSEELLPPLLAAGLTVEDIPLYETVYETHEQIREKIAAAFENGEVDGVTFTSASTVQGFVRTMEGLDYSQITAVCIGEQTAKAAGKYGMKCLISETAAIDSMVEKIIEHYGN